MIKRGYIYIIIFFSFLSCIKKESTKELIVGKDGYKYWVSHTATRDNASVLVINYFDENYKWLVFIVENDTFKKHELPYDVVRIEKWRLLNDSSIIFGESTIPDPYTILKLTQDSMIVCHKYDKTISVSTAAPDSLIPKKYRKILPNKY